MLATGGEWAHPHSYKNARFICLGVKPGRANLEVECVDCAARFVDFVTPRKRTIRTRCRACFEQFTRRVEEGQPPAPPPQPKTERKLPTSLLLQAFAHVSNAPRMQLTNPGQAQTYAPRILARSPDLAGWSHTDIRKSLERALKSSQLVWADCGRDNHRRKIYTLCPNTKDWLDYTASVSLQRRAPKRSVLD